MCTAHNGIHCDVCLTTPLQGVRYKCVVCADYDMCERCFARADGVMLHPPHHVFLAIRTPCAAIKTTAKSYEFRVELPDDDNESVKSGKAVAVAAAETTAPPPIVLYRGDAGESTSLCTTKALEVVMRHMGARNVAAFSPLSVAVAFAVLVSGGNEGVREDLARHVFGCKTGMPMTEMHDLAMKFITEVNTRKANLCMNIDATLKVATSVWVDTRIMANPLFVAHWDAANVQVYDKLPTASEINAWVVRETRGDIRRIASENVASSEPSAVIFNAVYFRGTWLHEFDGQRTCMSQFYTDCTRTVKKGAVALMRFREPVSLDVHECAEFVAVRLPYQRRPPPRMGFVAHSVNGSHTFFGDGAFGSQKTASPLEARIAVPRQKGDVALHAALEYVCRSEPRFEENRVCDVRLPRCRVTFGPTSLKPALESAGCRQMFVPGTGFPHMASGQLYVGDVIHCATVSFDERGTTATATTRMDMFSFGGSAPVAPVRVHCDSPFAYALYDVESKMLLFAGIVSEPQSP